MSEKSQFILPGMLLDCVFDGKSKITPVALFPVYFLPDDSGLGRILTSVVVVPLPKTTKIEY